MSAKQANSGWMTSILRAFRRLLPAVVLSANELRPKSTRCEDVRQATSDIRVTRQIFDRWAKLLDESTSTHPGEDETSLRNDLDTLRNDTAEAVLASEGIMRNHQQFAALMAKWLDSAATDWTAAYEMDISQEICVLAKNINDASDALSRHVAQMTEHIADLVSRLETMKGRTHTSKSVWMKLLGWLRYLFIPLSYLFKIGSLLAPFVLGFGFQPALSAASSLSMHIATICSKAKERTPEQTFENILHILKTEVPKEAELARRNLERFDDAHRLLQVEALMQTGRRVTMHRASAAAASQEWRVQQSQYAALLKQQTDVWR